MGWTLVNTRNGWQGGQEEEGPKRSIYVRMYKSMHGVVHSLREKERLSFFFFGTVSLFGRGQVNGLCQVAELG